MVVFCLSVAVSGLGRVTGSTVRALCNEILDDAHCGRMRSGFEVGLRDVTLVWVVECSFRFGVGMERDLAEFLCSRIVGRLVELDGLLLDEAKVVVRVLQSGRYSPLDGYIMLSVTFGGWEDGIQFQDSLRVTDEERRVAMGIRSLMMDRIHVDGEVGFQEASAVIGTEAGGRWVASEVRVTEDVLVPPSGRRGYRLS